MNKLKKAFLFRNFFLNFFPDHPPHTHTHTHIHTNTHIHVQLQRCFSRGEVLLTILRGCAAGTSKTPPYAMENILKNIPYPMENIFGEKVSLHKGLFFITSPYVRVCFSQNLPTQGSVFHKTVNSRVFVWALRKKYQKFVFSGEKCTKSLPYLKGMVFKRWAAHTYQIMK